MTRRLVLRSSLGAVALLAIAGGAWILSLPPSAPVAGAPPIAPDETAAAIAALKPPKRPRPVVATVGINDSTEVTDYLMPSGILRRADVAEVVLLATGRGPVKLQPALEVEPDATVAEFDAQYPEGADYVIVPAMSRDDDPAVIDWLRTQSAKGAIVIGVCAGAKVVAEADLLDGKRATTHWYSVEEMRREHPAIRYVPDRRIVVDQGVATTTGITASMPMALILIEAVAGRDKAEDVAADLGLRTWDARHDSRAFQFTRPFALAAIGNTLAFWRREQLGLELSPGIDEVSLALVADAWSRTYRSRAVTFAATAAAQPTRSGIRVVPDRVATSWPAATRLPRLEGRPAEALDQALAGIAARYGTPTGDFVAVQLEYPREALARR
jgi:putative intracellular protease/amidase